LATGKPSKDTPGQAFNVIYIKSARGEAKFSFHRPIMNTKRENKVPRITSKGTRKVGKLHYKCREGDEKTPRFLDIITCVVPSCKESWKMTWNPLLSTICEPTYISFIILSLPFANSCNSAKPTFIKI
jgi:hypothetical protein